MIDISRKIREIRKNMRLNQADFAKRLGVSQGSVSKWESGRETPRLETLSKLSKESGLNLFSLRSGREHSHIRDRGGIRPTKFVGNIQHGYYVESPYWDEGEQFTLDLPYTPIWQTVDLKAWIIKGVSPWPQYPSGTVIITASELDEDDLWPDDPVPSGFDYEDGDIVVVSLRNPNGLREVTIKKFVLHDHQSIAYLWPLEAATIDKTMPIPLTFGKKAWDNVDIIGLVVASLRYEADPSRLVDVPAD